ncbi:MAG: hypothetical protein HC820_02115 [Hydrococcus sp. RM1_1_31]|nr:hypothetical protein [Hydrococcus sp. RM1_1_31]
MTQEKETTSISPEMATTEGVTKEECDDIPGSHGWEEYGGQDDTPKDERLGTCYHEGTGD